MSTDEWRQFATTVGGLKEALAGVPDDTPVILEKDAEDYEPDERDVRVVVLGPVN